MRVLKRRLRVQITPEACILWAAALLILPLPWIAAVAAAAAIHEVCHWLALTALGIPVGELCLDWDGARMVTGAMTPRQEWISALAGPAGSLLLGLIMPLFPGVAIIGMVQGIINLLPIYPRDGGRALRVFLGDKSEPVEIVTRVLIVVGLLLLGIRLKWYFPLFATIFFLPVPKLMEKDLAKRRRTGYNSPDYR